MVEEKSTESIVMTNKGQSQLVGLLQRIPVQKSIKIVEAGVKMHLVVVVATKLVKEKLNEN